MTRIIYFIALLIHAAPTLAANEPYIVAASNMTHALTEIAEKFKQESGLEVKLSFGSSGNFARQIIEGAPYKLFLPADKKYIDLLAENGVAIDFFALFALGRIGFFIPNDSLLKDYNYVDDIIKSIINGRFRRIAIANPEHAPYGAAAVQALRHAGLWAIERDKLVVGESAAQAIQFTLSGSIDLGVIPTSYAHLPGITAQGKFYPIPENWYQPIRQYIVLLRGADKATIRFYHYLLSDGVKEILKRYDYVTESVR